MTDPIRDMAGYIERFGCLKIRDKGGRAEIELMLQFDDPDEANRVAVLYRRKIYKFNDVTTVYFSGTKMFLWLAVSRDYLCPAHRRVVTLAVQISELNKKRMLMGKLQARGRRPQRFKDGCRKKNVALAQIRSRLFEDLRHEQDRLELTCPVWGALGVPHQRRLKEWWAENRPEENKAYWKERDGRQG